VTIAGATFAPFAASISVSAFIWTRNGGTPGRTINPRFERDVETARAIRAGSPP